MKKAGFVLFAAALLVLGAGCASPGRAILLSEPEPVALVSVVANWDINWHGEDPVNPNFIGASTRRALHADPDLTIVSNTEELIYTAERHIREIMGWSGIIELADRETVLLSRAYQEAGLNRRRMSRPYVLPAGYRLINPRDREFPQALAAETGIRRSMFVEFTFTKAMRSGFARNGNSGANLDMGVLILDAGGRTLYNRTFSLGSRGAISVSNGMYSHSGLMALFDALIIDACHEFLYRLEGW
ncbi:MAG: hypothetical protein FWC64_03230 [Treponema sp.]|nr:hypothetical protein [Treponema sp.]